MPEMLEAERYRTLAAGAVDRTIAMVEAPDALILRRGLTAEEVVAAAVGSAVRSVRRTGKVVFLDLSSGHVLAVRFGMTGVLELDGSRGVEDLRYGPSRRDPAWVRFALVFDDGGVLALHDPRRLGGIELDPDEAALGPDAAELTPATLRAALGTSTSPLKARLMDQRRIAGLGNLLTDEILWRAGLDPARPSGSLDEVELERLVEVTGATLAELGDRGGSHLGDLPRVPGASCPLDGGPLDRRTVGGRTTYWCPAHQA